MSLGYASAVAKIYIEAYGRVPGLVVSERDYMEAVSLLSDVIHGLDDAASLLPPPSPFRKDVQDLVGSMNILKGACEETVLDTGAGGDDNERLVQESLDLVGEKLSPVVSYIGLWPELKTWEL